MGYNLPYSGAEVETLLSKLETLNAQNMPISEAVALLYALGEADANVDKALSLISSAKFYGKRSQISGGSAHSGSAGAGYISFTTKDNDDFNMVNLATYPSRLTIPSGVKLVRAFWYGQANGNYHVGVGISVNKNGSVIEQIHYDAPVNNDEDSVLIGTRYSKPISVVAGDYLQLYATPMTYSGYSSSLSAGSIFGLEVLG